jgi:hypothetical protein
VDIAKASNAVEARFIESFQVGQEGHGMPAVPDRWSHRHADGLAKLIAACAMACGCQVC